MTDVTVSLNRDGLNTVEADEGSVTVTQGLSVALENYGKPTHVHLHPDDELATMGTVEDPHWFIPEGEWREVELQLSEAATGQGRLKIEAGYGQEQVTIDVTVQAPSDVEPEPVESGRSEEGGEPNDESAPDTAATFDSTEILSTLDAAALQDPVVLGAGGAFGLLLIGMLAAAPLGAVGAAVGAVLGGIAVWGYYRQTADGA